MVKSRRQDKKSFKYSHFTPLLSFNGAKLLFLVEIQIQNIWLTRFQLLSQEIRVLASRVWDQPASGHSQTQTNQIGDVSYILGQTF